MTEQWRCVLGVGGYLVSDQGRVRGPRRILTPSLVDGYPKVTLCPGNGARLHRRVHTLVLEAFLGPKPDGLVARHIDGVRTNCSISNLAWGTQIENEADRKRHGTDNSGERSGRSKLTWDEIEEIRRDYKPKTRGVGNKSLARKYGVSASTMLLIIKGVIWRTGDWQRDAPWRQKKSGRAPVAVEAN